MADSRGFPEERTVLLGLREWAGRPWEGKGKSREVATHNLGLQNYPEDGLLGLHVEGYLHVNGCGKTYIYCEWDPSLNRTL